MSRALEVAWKLVPPGHFTSDARIACTMAYEQAEQDIISLIESRIAEILGDAQPAPVLRAELRELINKIKEDKK